MTKLARARLPERSDCFPFEHKASEVNYGGGARFHQAAFPPGERPGQDLEALAFRAVHRFVELLQKPTAGAEMSLPPGSELTGIYFDQWGETPRLSAAAFVEWTRREVGDVAECYRRLRLCAVSQEKDHGVPQLGYLVGLAAVTLISTVITEFFEKQIEHLGPLATQARLTLGRGFALALSAAEGDPELRQRRLEQHGRAETEECCRRVLNPFCLGFADRADIGLMEEILAEANPYRLSGRLRQRLLALVQQALARSRSVEITDPRRCLSEPGALEAVLRSARDRRRLVKALRRQPELLPQLVLENVQVDLRATLREAVVGGQCPALLPYVANDRQLSELLTRSATRAKLLKTLKEQGSSQAQAVRDALREGLRRVRRSRRGLFGRLGLGACVAELTAALRRLGAYLADTEDFRLLRSHFGRDTNRSLEWQGLRLWRAYELVHTPQAAPAERLALVPVWDRIRADVENAFAEGNLFLCRDEGDIYPPSSRRRTRTLFLFADLRNSTETTMKLTKDTASFLAPYLTAVDSEARGAGGERIYFAGDGYAAHYGKAGAAVRAAYSIAGRFHKLRLASAEELRRKAKDILQTLRALNLDWRRPAALQKAWKESGLRSDQPELRDLLGELVGRQPGSLNEEAVRQALLKVAEAYSMPRIEAGIGITGGDLFLALVGEEGQPKTPIVISPALTQAARLSGSSEAVKSHLDDKYQGAFVFNAQVWEQKLYNRGIVITQDVLEDLRLEQEIKPISSPDTKLAKETMLFYNDTQLNKRLIIRDLLDTVSLKGIGSKVKIFEVAPPFSFLDKHFNP
jgi:hypothetical protein